MKLKSHSSYASQLACAVFALMTLAACAPGELKKPAGEGAGKSGQTTGTVAVTTQTVAAAPETTAPQEETEGAAREVGIVQFPAAAAPEGFKLPWPDALPATTMIHTGKRGGSLTASVIGEPKTFDPLTSNESSSSQVIGQMFSTLIGYDPGTQDYYPFMLKSLTLGEDQLTWTATLRDGMKWSDGQPITSDDVVFTAEVTYDPNVINPAADVLQVAGKPMEFKKVDNLTFTVTTAEPTGFMHVMLGSFTPLPKHALEEAWKGGQYASAMNVNIDPAKLVVSGPFKLQTYQPGERVVLVRNDNYFRVDKNGERLPYLDSIVFSIAPDMDSMAAKFRAGEADTLDGPRPEMVPDLREAQRRENFSLYDNGAGDTAGFFWFNLKQGNNAEGKPYVDPELQKVFADENFRKAIYHAINRDAMTRTVLRGLAVKADSMTPVGLKDWYNPNLPQYEYDPEKAKQMLDAAGYKDTNGDLVREMPNGKPLAFTFITNVENKTRTELATIIATDLRGIGIQATPQSVDFNTLVTQLNDSFQYEACLLGFTGSIHPMTSMNVWRSTGRTHYWNPLQKTPATPWEAEIDKLADQFVSALEFSKQQSTFFKMQELLMNHLPTLPLYYPKQFSCVRNKFGNVRTTPFGSSFWNAEELFVK